MLRPRIIPSLLVHKKGLVKTEEFKQSKYVGDPINAVKIFNEKEVDELIVLDIDATIENRGPDFEMIKNLAIECRMPFCYGGGVTTVNQAQKIVQLGAEKVAFSSAAINNSELLKEVGAVIGVQSVVVVLDYKKKGLFGKLEIFTHNGNKATGLGLFEFVKELGEIGVGEIVLNSIERDGKMNGYDIATIEKVRDIFQGPITVLGGAGSLEDIKVLTNKFKIIGAAAGSLFVFKGKYKAVLINYPSFEEKKMFY
ncbi:AglZ/HisF2 family acetamidino modification protein [Mesoflavibacter zeaxanthinifaciens]|uniref:AglZ/HisF2 family acetamidino modification protein n=1 Tax=Mesoflavibacter zeaxanthinifaciens TaxID=393060 RepID=UPI003A95C4D8